MAPILFLSCQQNLYGPNDNFNLETSHVLPALVRKIHLGKALENKDWDTVFTDLNKRPIEGVNGSSSKEEILRMLNTYGINQLETEDSVIKTQIEIWGSGKPMREFLWSEDMADACVFIMENRNFEDTVATSVDGNFSEVRNTHINIGTGKEISIAELARVIKKTLDFKGNLIFNTNKPDGTMRKLTDPSKLHSLGWKHSIDLEKGIGLMYKHYLNNDK